MSVHVLIIGLNHSTAPVEIREKLNFPGNQEGEVTRLFAQQPGIEELMILSTCNRSEIISVYDGEDESKIALLDYMSAYHNTEPSKLEPYLYIKENQEAVRHIFRVSSSLDSMVLGEPQILGQVKDSFRLASAVNSSGPVLNRLMHRSFFTAKRVRTETNVGASAVSVAYVAVELARKILGELQNKAVLLIGAGEMAELAAKHLANFVTKPVTVVNRTYENACSLASQLKGAAMKMNELENALLAADVVITSTGSCDPVICAPNMKSIMKMRRSKPIFLIDIAIPRDVEPAVNDIDGIYLYNIDDLQMVVTENIGERRNEAQRGEEIVDEEVTKFMNWTRTLDSTPTIVALINKLEEIRRTEIEKLNGKISKLDQVEKDLA